MPDAFIPTPAKAYLATYRPPALRFAASADLPAALAPLWEALRTVEDRVVAERLQQTLRDTEIPLELRAPLLAALASVELRRGRVEMAQRLAETSLLAHPSQWMARRVLLELHLSQQDHADAYAVATSFAEIEATPLWDEPLTPAEHHLALAACAWLSNDWDATATQLHQAYPEGVGAMPHPVQEDWFRLAFYRASPEDAEAAARPLIAARTPERADELLQTLVKQGWNAQALSLYRTLFARDPQSELLRRRLVGLCIREGALDEARTLMEHGALHISV